MTENEGECQMVATRSWWKTRFSRCLGSTGGAQTSDSLDGILEWMKEGTWRSGSAHALHYCICARSRVQSPTYPVIFLGPRMPDSPWTHNVTPRSSRNIVLHILTRPDL